MNCGIDSHGNPVSEPLDSVSQVLQWTPPMFCCNSAIQVHKESSSQLKLRCRPQNRKCPQMIVCHDMCGGYLDDRFSQGCQKSSPYIFSQWALIDIFIYFSHHFVTIPPIGWIKAAHKHGVTVLGTIITEWDEGAEICKEILGSQEVVDQLTTKLAEIAVFYGFDGWLINIENAIMVEHIPMLQTFVRQLTEKCHRSLGDPKVLWYDSVINTGELKWQDELNYSNEMFFNVCDGIFLNYNITEEKLTRSKELAMASNRPFDVFAGIDVFGRSTPGGGGFNCKEDLKMIYDIGLSCALFAPGWVFEHLGPENFVRNEIMFWGILRDLLTPRPTEVPFATSFCKGNGEHYFLNGQLLSDKPWHNLVLQQLQPSFTHSQFETYRITKIIEEVKSTQEESEESEKKQKLRIEAEKFETHPASPMMEFDLTDGYTGGGCLKLSAKAVNSQPVLFRLFRLNRNGRNIDIKISITTKIPEESQCEFGIVLHNVADSSCYGRSIVWTEKTLDDTWRNSIENLLNDAKKLPIEDKTKTSVIFETSATTNESLLAHEHRWKTSSFIINRKLLFGEDSNLQDLVLSAVLIPSVNNDGKENTADVMCVRIGYLKVQQDSDLKQSQEDIVADNLRCLEVRPISHLTCEDKKKIAMNSCFAERNPPRLDQAENIRNEDFITIKKAKIDDSHLGLSSKQIAKATISVDKNNTGHMSQAFSIETLELTQSAVATSSNGLLFRLYCLKWGVSLSRDIDHFMIFCHEQSGTKTFIGHAGTTCFVWKQKEEERRVPAYFSVVPVMSLTQLPI